MAFREVYVCEILISEIEGRSVLYGCLLKEYSDKVRKRGCGEKCARVQMEMVGIVWEAKYRVSQEECARLTEIMAREV